MEHWFVYYKLPADEVDAVAVQVERMMAALRAATGVPGRLLQKAGESGGTITLLEVYEPIAAPDKFEHALVMALNRTDLPSTLRAARRTERFCDL